MYDSQLDLMPSGSPSRATSDQRSPALWRGAPPNQGWVPSGVKVRQMQDGLKIDTTCSAHVLAESVLAAWLTRGLGRGPAASHLK